MTATLAPARVLREATLDDVPRLVDLGCRFLAETIYGDWIPTNPEQMQRLLDRLITHADSVVIVSQASDGVVDGMIGILVQPHFLSAEVTAMEVFWWSEGRGMSGARLLTAGEAWARATGAVAMQMIAPSERIGAFYEKRGYTLLERAYVRRFDR